MKFYVIHDGDPSVGLPGDRATVEMNLITPVDDPDHAGEIRYTKACLVDCFRNLWEWPAYVLTEDELASRSKEDGA